MALKNRKSVGGNGPSPVIPLQACLFSKRFPGLWSFLTQTRWDDGKTRETGTILLCVNDGRVKAWLNDRDAGLTCWVSAESLEALLKAVEGALEGEDGEWRQAKPQGHQGAKKRP